MADIELMIKIPEDVYREIMAHNRELREGAKSAYYFEGLIQNGTPLPKGHGRLIDADGLELDYEWSEYETDTGQLIVNGYQAYSSTQIESALTIIEADKEK